MRINQIDKERKTKMKIENRMKYGCIKEALIRWVLGTDGQDGEICDLLDAIPWDEEMDSVISWDDVYDEIKDSFGCRTDENNKHWDVAIILTDNNEFKRFDKFITKKTINVMDVYQGIIDKVNRLCNTKSEIVVHKFIGVENNVAQYKPLFHYCGNSLTSLANKVYDKLKVSDWEKDVFIDSVHCCLYNKSRTAFKSNNISDTLSLDVIKND
jgi:hypothetical protein